MVVICYVLMFFCVDVSLCCGVVVVIVCSCCCRHCFLSVAFCCVVIVVLLLLLSLLLLVARFVRFVSFFSLSPSPLAVSCCLVWCSFVG